MQHATSQEMAGFFLILALVVVLGFIASSRRPEVKAEAPSKLQVWKQHGLPNYIADPEAGARHTKELARKSGGDWNKLSEEEQRWLNSMTAGHGPRMLAHTASKLGPNANSELARTVDPILQRKGVDKPQKSH